MPDGEKLVAWQIMPTGQQMFCAAGASLAVYAYYPLTSPSEIYDRLAVAKKKRRRKEERGKTYRLVVSLATIHLLPTDVFTSRSRHRHHIPPRNEQRALSHVHVRLSFGRDAGATVAVLLGEKGGAAGVVQGVVVDGEDDGEDDDGEHERDEADEGRPPQLRPVLERAPPVPVEPRPQRLLLAVDGPHLAPVGRAVVIGPGCNCGGGDDGRLLRRRYLVVLLSHGRRD